jgi:thioredoxin-dependent peroxiredoxin
MSERKAAVLWGGKPVDLLGPALARGDKAPSAFTLYATDLSAVPGASLAGKSRIVCAVPSLDTAVCDVEMKRFNKEVEKLASVTLYVVSLDLPFAMKRWCGATGSDKVQPLSDYKDRSFGPAYGVLAPSKGLFARAVFVIDKNDKLVHVEYVKEVAEEPSYAAALDAARAML